MNSLLSLDLNIVWGLYPRFIALAYLIAFISLSKQLMVWGGENGILPLKDLVSSYKRDFSFARRLSYFPSYFWINNSDKFIKFVFFLGLFGALIGICGGWYGKIGLFLAWSCYLSLSKPYSLEFPWDSFLLEIGFLTLLIPHVGLLPEISISEMPLPIVVFLHQWTLIRLMWGFAKVKFYKADFKDKLYLKGFYIWMPMPNPLGWLLNHAPNWFHSLCFIFMFCCEVFMPGLCLTDGMLRIIGGSALFILMSGIFFTGNFGFFNLLYAFALIIMLDTRFTFIHAFQSIDLSSFNNAVIYLISMLLIITGLINLILWNSWVARGWVYMDWHKYENKFYPLKYLLVYFRLINPFRINNAYGVFPPSSKAPMRITPVFQGSSNGDDWIDYELKYVSSKAEHRPQFVSPHHPRLAFLMGYFAEGNGDSGDLLNHITIGDPYLCYNRHSVLVKISEQLLNNDAQVLSLFLKNPFKNFPPKYIRIVLRAITPTSMQEKSKTKFWWKTKDITVLFEKKSLDNFKAKIGPPSPEIFHPGFTYFKVNSNLYYTLVNNFKQSPASFIQSIPSINSDITTICINDFWNKFVPLVNQFFGQWEDIDKTHQKITSHFSITEINKFELITERYCLIIRHLLRTHNSEHLINETPLKINLIAQCIVFRGSEELEKVVNNINHFTHYVNKLEDAELLFPITIFRIDMIKYHIRIFKWSQLMYRLHQEGIKGIIEFYPFLKNIKLKYQFWIPQYHKNQVGEWKVNDFIE